MFTGIIQTILLHHVGKYLNGLDKNSFNVGLIDGQITIQNIGLNNTLFDELQIPLTLKFSNIQKIHIEVPWTKLDEKPTIVTIEGINILLDLSELKSLTESTIAFKFQQIISKIKKELEPKEEKQKDKKEKKKEGFAERSLIRILDNVDLTLRNLHVRFEDNSSFKKHCFSFGILIKDLMFHTTNQQGNKVFYKRSFAKGANNPPVYRQLKATEIKAYWNSQETVFVKEVVESGADRDHILQFMKMGFPQSRDDIASPVKKQKESDFLKDLFKSKGQKQKQKQKLQKDKLRYEQYKVKMAKMKFNTILDMILTVQSSQNDLNDKQKPLFEAKVWIQPVKVQVGQLLMSQMLCLLQYYLKYTQDLFYYQNKTKKGGMGNSENHKKIFNDVMQELFKKLPKIKSLSQIPKQTFKNKQDQQAFQSILDLQSLKNLGSFASDFVTGMKLKKQIEKAQKNIKKKQKAKEQIQKLMQKTKITEGQNQQIEIDYKGRVLIDLDCEIGGVSVKINQQINKTVTQSIRVILPLTKFFLKFVNQKNFSSKLTSKDLLLDYTAMNKYLDLHGNQHDDFINIQFNKQGKSMVLNAKIQKKEFIFPENLIAFVIKFIQPIHITPFFLNLFQQSTNIDSEAARSMIDGLMSIVPNMKSKIQIDLPKVQVQLKSSGIIIDCGKLTVNVTEQGCYKIPINLQGLNIFVLDGQNKTQLIPDISTNINFIRQFQSSDHQDSIRFQFDKIEVIVPQVNIFDKLSTQIFQLTKDILKKQIHLIDRNKTKLSQSIKLNSNPQSQPLYLLGQMLEIPYSTPEYIILYQTIAYPLSIKQKYFIVLLKKRRVNYIEVFSQEQMQKLIQLLNQHIEGLSTINQLKHIWHINSKYQSNDESISKNTDKLMTFICESESSDNLLSQVDVHLNLKTLIAKFCDITIKIQQIDFQHVQYNQMGEDKLFIKDVSIFIKDQKFICGSTSNKYFLQFYSTLIISQKIDINLSQIALFLTNQNISPLLQSMHQILQTTILRQALTFNPQKSTLYCRQFFNILQLQSSIKIKQLQCSIMQCAGFIAENLHLKSKLQSNSQQIILLVQGMDIFQMMKFSDLQLRRIMMIDLQNILEIKYKSLLFEMSPQLLIRYLAIIETNKDAIISHYQTVLEVVKFMKQSSYLIPTIQSNQKISIIGSNIQLQLVQNQQNILQILVHQFMFQLNIHNDKISNYIVSLMQVSINQQKSNFAIPIIKNFSVILKSNVKNDKHLLSLAVTKLQVMVGIYILDYVYRMTKSLHTIFLRNQWIVKFIINMIKQDPQLNKIIQSIKAKQISVNLQLDQIAVLYIRNDNIPYLKLKLKINQSVLDIGKQIGLHVGVNISLLYFNNAVKIFEPIIQPVEFQTSYSKSSRLQSLKISTKSLKINVSSQTISQTMVSFEELQQFIRKHKDSVDQIINTITRIKQNKILLILKQEGRMRSPSKNKQDFTKGFTIRNFKQPRNIQPENHLSIINLSGTLVSINLVGNQLDLHADLANKTQQMIPIKIKSQYKHNYQILQRVRCFKILLDIDKHDHQLNFSISKMIDQKKELSDGKYIRLKSLITNEGMDIFIVGRIKIINSTPQKFVVKVGVDFCQQILQNSQLYLPYYAQEDFKLSMLSSSVVVVPISNKQTFQQLQFVTFSSDHHTILLTSEVKDDSITYRLMDSMKIFNHFDFKLQFRLDDTGFILQPNSTTSTSKTSLKQVKNVQLSIPSIGKWISVPINKLSTSQKQLQYPLQKQNIKIYIILFKSKMGRLIHIYPRLAILNLTPYKLTLYTSLYQSLFIVNKRLINQQDQKHQPKHIKGFVIDYQQTNDCFVLDQERYLHLSFINNKQKSEQFIGYDSDFNRTVDIKDQNYEYKIKVTYESSFLTEEISIFKANLKPKLYFVNKSDYVIKVYDWIIKSNHLIPFAHPINSPKLQLELDYQGINYKLISEAQLHNQSRWNLLLIQEQKYNQRLKNKKQLNKEQQQKQKQGNEQAELKMQTQIQLYDDFEILRFGIELIFKQGFGYYVFSRNTQYIVINNTLQQKRLIIFDNAQIKIKYQIPVGQKRKYYYRSQIINIQIIGLQNEVIEDIVLNLNEPSNTQLQSCSISTYFQNLDRVITFSDIKEQGITFFNEQHGKPERMLSLSIDQISVSFIFYNFDEVRCETLYLKIINTNFLQIQYQKMIMLEFKAKNLTLISKQINQINQILSKQNTKKQFINTYVQIPKQRNIILSFKLQISPIRVCVSDELLELVLFNIEKLGLFKQNTQENNNRQFQIFFEFYNKTRQEKVGDKILWKIVNLTIKQIQFEIEFKKCFVKGNRQRMKSFGFSLAELKADKLSLSKLQINNSQQSISEFGKAIANQYKKQIVSIVGGVLGGLNIIGNPRQFVLEIQSSLSQSNPGIIRGTGGFFKGVAVGTVNSASKITGVVGNGLSLLSLDQKYLQERQMIKNRSITNASEGLKAGASSFYKGLESGITGLVTQPVRGLQEQGVFGIFKGSLKGVVGFFTKPVVGALDAASMTTQGLASISKASKQQETIHERIRPLYYQRKIIRPQCEVQQTCCLFLDKYFHQFYISTKLIQTFLLEQQEDPDTLTSVLVLTLNQIMVIDIISKQVVLEIVNEKMSAVGKFTQGVVLYYIDEEEQEIEVILRLKRSNQLKHLLYLSLQKIIETFRVGQ